MDTCCKTCFQSPATVHQELSRLRVSKYQHQVYQGPPPRNIWPRSRHQCLLASFGTSSKVKTSLGEALWDGWKTICQYCFCSPQLTVSRGIDINRTETSCILYTCKLYILYTIHTLRIESSWMFLAPRQSVRSGAEFSRYS